MRNLILARHGHTASNAARTVSGLPPGDGLSELGVAQALALGERFAAEPVDLGVATELRRTQQTLELALHGRSLPRLVLPALNEIRVGAFEAGPLDEYRRWAWEAAPDASCPGGGESRTAAAARFASGLETLLARPEETIVHVGHALTIRYVLRGANGAAPLARVGRVPHAVPYRLRREQVEAAARTLRAWAAAPRFAGDNERLEDRRDSG